MARTTGWTRITRRAVTGQALLGGVLLASVTAGCFARPAPELTASDILSKASDALKKVTSVHFRLVSTNGMMAIGTGLVAKTIEGDVVSPDKLKGTAVSTFGRLTVDVSFIVIGSQEYITNPISKQWQPVPSAVSAPNLLDPDHGAPALLKAVTDPTKEANETVDGTVCYHVTGKIAAALIAGLVGAAGTPNTLVGDILVGTNDFLVRQIRLAGPIATNEPPGIQRTLTLSDFNEKVTIEAPRA